MFVKDLESLKYAELQKLAKSVGIKANQRVDRLIKALKEHYIEKETEDREENCQKDVSTSSETSEKQDGKAGQIWRARRKNFKNTVEKKNQSGSESEETKCENTKSKGDGTRQKRVQDAAKSGLNKLKRSTDLTVRSPLFSPLRNMSASLAALRKATPSTPLSSKKHFLERSTPSNTTVNTPGDKCTKKRRRTFELDEPTLSAQNTPSLDDQPGTTHQKSQVDTQNMVGQEEPASKRVRKNTYDKDDPSQADIKDGAAQQATTLSNGSPGTRAMIEDMDNLSSAERKEQLLSALDKKIKNRVPASPAQGSCSQPSQIPRFMAFLANKKAESQKPVTPGSKDWTKIHKKEFSKFDSLDVYLEKKHRRMEKLTESAKRSTVVRLSERKGPKIARPVHRLQLPVTEVKPFVPTVTSTKNINFNFNKTPVTLHAKTPSDQKPVNLLGTQNILRTPRIQGPVTSAKKSIVTGSKTTPFIFTGNSSSNTTVASHKKTFDLKASLAKPITWKPHTGKLQPVDVNKLQPPSTAATRLAKQKLERPSRQAMASKTRPINAKDVRRNNQLDRRNNQKYIDMMKRRGLLA